MRLVPIKILLLTLLPIIRTTFMQIPLTYAFDPVIPQKKYPIKLSFNSSSTTVPFLSPYLPLYNLNITMQTTRIPPSQTEQVTIGLKHPSIFLTALQRTLSIEPTKIQISKDDYLKLIINGHNLVESSDQFINNGTFGVRAVYNFGEGIRMDGQKWVLTDSQLVVFDEEVLMEIVNRLAKDKRNKIDYVLDQKKRTITVSGNLENFPKISLTTGKSNFELDIKLPTLYYHPRSPESSQAISTVGYKALPKFSKFQIQPSESTDSSPNSNLRIIFKRTSQLYQLYIFLGYFFVFTLGFIVVSRDKLEGSMIFVRSVIDWAIFHNQEARVRVLRTQLQ